MSLTQPVSVSTTPIEVAKDTKLNPFTPFRDPQKARKIN